MHLATNTSQTAVIGRMQIDNYLMGVVSGVGELVDATVVGRCCELFLLSEGHSRRSRRVLQQESQHSDTREQGMELWSDAKHEHSLRILVRDGKQGVAHERWEMLYSIDSEVDFLLTNSTSTNRHDSYETN